jgi:heme-degrading monooxygenase HmoA
MNSFICIFTIATLLLAIGLCESFVLKTPTTTLLSLTSSSFTTTTYTSIPTSTFTSTSTAIFSSTTKTTDEDETTASSDDDDIFLKRDRYVVTNRLAVRAGKEAKFEKNWATRKSRLATLQGFKYFHLMRRVTLNDNDKDKDNDNDNDEDTFSYDGGNDKESAHGNYVSFTIWEKKSDFSAWRKGDAFKEAHGGTSIKAFVSTMVKSALVLRGVSKILHTYCYFCIFLK